MNELKGKFLNLVLCVEEGQGFDQVRCPFYITANFNGRKMDSDIVEGGVVSLSTELVWETDRKLLRKARTAYQNIRLECCTSDKKLIGYTLLCIRNAKILTASKANQPPNVTLAWNRLHGVPGDWRRGNPELKLALLIRDYIPNIKLSEASKKKTTTTPHLPELPALHFKLVRVPVKYSAEEGYIQLGNPEDCNSKFQLKLSLMTGWDLDVLLPEKVVFGTSRPDIQLSVETFGLNVKSKKFSEDVYARRVILNECIVINLCSNYQLLDHYFSQFSKIVVKLELDEKVVARAEIDMSKLNLSLPEDHFDNCGRSFQMEQICFFDPYQDEARAVDPARRASVVIECILVAVDIFDDTKDEAKMSEINQELKIHNLSSDVTLSSFDGLTSELSLVSNASELSMFIAEFDYDDVPDGDCCEYECVIKFEGITWLQEYDNGDFLLSIRPPFKGDVYERRIRYIPTEEKQLEDESCTFTFSTRKGWFNYMAYFYCLRIAVLAFDTKVLVGRAVFNDKIAFEVSKTSAPSQLHVVDLQDEQMMYFTVVTTTTVLRTSVPETQDMIKSPPLLIDASFFANALENLDEQLVKKREDFDLLLQKERDELIGHLKDEWHQKSSTLQEELLRNIQKCYDLLEKHEKSKIRAEIAKEIDERAQSRDYSMVMEIHKNTVKYSYADKQELIEVLSDLEVKMTIQQDLLADTTRKMQELKKTQLTADQTKILLKDLTTMEQKYEISQRDKNYFKCEYEKAMKEVHNLKVDYHKNIAMKIAYDKEELNNLVTNPCEESLSTVAVQENTSQDSLNTSTDSGVPPKTTSDDYETYQESFATESSDY